MPAPRLGCATDAAEALNGVFCANVTAAFVNACTNGAPPVIRFSRVM